MTWRRDVILQHGPIDYWLGRRILNPQERDRYSLGSRICPYRLAARTRAFQPRNLGSTPSRDANAPAHGLRHLATNQIARGSTPLGGTFGGTWLDQLSPDRIRKPERAERQLKSLAGRRDARTCRRRQRATASHKRGLVGSTPTAGTKGGDNPKLPGRTTRRKDVAGRSKTSSRYRGVA